MYKLFLDDSMTYSCGIWTPGAHWPALLLLLPSKLC